MRETRKYWSRATRHDLQVLYEDFWRGELQHKRIRHLYCDYYVYFRYLDGAQTLTALCCAGCGANWSSDILWGTEDFLGKNFGVVPQVPNEVVYVMYLDESTGCRKTRVANQDESMRYWGVPLGNL